MYLNKLITTITIILALHVPPRGAHWLPHWPTPSSAGPASLCANQFALVNRACLMIGKPPPVVPILPPPDLGGEKTSTVHRRHRRHGHRGHGHGHGHRVHDHDHDHDYDFGHDYGHEHEHEHLEESPAEEECCRWLKEVDSMCACDLLVHLPPFLIKPIHSYTVVVDDACSVTFHCEPKK